MWRLACFNPRPRVGGDSCRRYQPSARRAFQSAPPRGGRCANRRRRADQCSFNPRPRVGGDNNRGTDRTRTPGFNPRPRVGGDQGVNAFLALDRDVSIRAPAWGAITSTSRGGLRCQFQSAPPRGGRCLRSPHAWSADLFQSAPPRGGRCSPFSQVDGCGMFQSAPPRGGRFLMASMTSWLIVFQSAPPRGGRYGFLGDDETPLVFQSAPPRGGRWSSVKA